MVSKLKNILMSIKEFVNGMNMFNFIIVILGFIIIAIIILSSIFGLIINEII